MHKGRDRMTIRRSKMLVRVEVALKLLTEKEERA